MINYPILVLSVCTMAVTVVRLMQLPRRRLPLWEVNRHVGGFALVAVASLVYSLHHALNDVGPWKNAGTVTFHVLVVGIGVSIELVLYTLRSRTVDLGTVRRIAARGGVIAVFLTALWVVGFTDREVGDLFDLRGEPAVRTYGVVFHSYLVWVLTALVVTFAGQARRRAQQRPIKAASYVLVALGCACFAVVNAVFLSAWLIEWDPPSQALWVGAPVYFGLIVAGLVLVGVGEAIADELSALRTLHVMGDLWTELRRICDIELAVARTWSAQMRLQRAYAETADALASLSPTDPIDPTPQGVAQAIWDGQVRPVHQVGSVSLADILPPRTSRTHDQRVMEAVAAAYRQRRRATRGEQHAGARPGPAAR